MTEKEKKAIENVKLYLYKDKAFITADEIDLVFNLIQKQDTEINKLNKEIKQLKEDISNMYDEKVVRNILENECGLSKYEIDEILN